MKKLYVLLLLAFATVVKGQLLVTTPDFPKETDANVVITMDATKGNQGLLNYNPADVYVHLGAITTLSTSSSDWRYVPFDFNSTNPAAKAVSLGSNKWSYTLTGTSVRAFFGITNPAEHILKVAILFRNGAGTQVQRNTDGSDMYVPFYDAGLQVKITNPYRQPTYVPVPEPITKNIGDNIAVEAKCSQSANLKLYFNGTLIASTTGTTVSTNPQITAGGNQRIIAEAELSGVFKRDTINFFVSGAVITEPLPAGLTDGINYEADPTAVTLVLFAPLKATVTILGDFNNWTQNTAYQMKRTPDGQRFWLRITGLTAGTEYAYQYLIDNSLKLADYNAEKILDPANDPFIPVATYPNLKPYPTGLTTGIVSVLQTAKPQYNWSSTAYTRPDKRNLVLYELLVRDFVANHDWKTLTDTLNYLKRLGINSIHVMPFNEFEGNNSWGYNPSFYLAPDKYYGPENDLRRFIDSAHAKGMAVIMDIVLNHAYGQSPMVQMYWDAANNRPAANSPWFNPVAPHTWLTFGYDFNQDAQATKDYTDKVITHWLSKYRLDGFRWDFTKGFSQRSAPTEPASAAYDAGRISILKRIYDKMQAVTPGSICILEHFAANTEEKELSDYGMLLWGNLNYNYSGAARGALAESDFSWGIFTSRTWSNPTLLTYAESHDEERLMYRNLNEGNSYNSYNIRNVNTALKRQEMVAAFFIPVPGPKLIWQFGELGYDYGINRCEDGSYNNNCRLSPKPIRWDYYQEAARRALYNVYANLNRLKTNPAYTSTFTGSNITWDLSSAFKWMKINGPSINLMVLGNFDVGPQSGTVTFQNAGIWYSYLTGTTITATGAPQIITLQPGEYYVYTNVNIPLPLKLLSLTGSRTTDAIKLAWQTSNEENVKNFEIQRSPNGTDYTTIGTMAALNNSSTANNYVFDDKQDEAINAKTTLYYRLKMNDVDGKFTWSRVVAIAPIKNKDLVLLYPNPVTGTTLQVQVKTGASSKIILQVQDVSGRIIRVQTLAGIGIGSTSIPVDVSGLPSGTYQLKIISDSNTSVKPFSVQH